MYMNDLPIGPSIADIIVITSIIAMFCLRLYFQINTTIINNAFYDPEPRGSNMLR